MRAMTTTPGSDAATPAPKTSQLHLALLGGFAREGAWRLPRRTIAISLVGGVDLDFTQAVLPEGESAVIKVSLVGGVKLTVPADVNVVIDGFNLIGSRSTGTVPSIAGAPTVRVRAYGIVGGVKLHRV